MPRSTASMKSGKKDRIVIRVLPRFRISGLGWVVKRDGQAGGLKEFPRSSGKTKHDAICYARSFAIIRLMTGLLSQVVIHKKDGTIQNEWTYGEDIVGSKG